MEISSHRRTERQAREKVHLPGSFRGKEVSFVECFFESKSLFNVKSRKLADGIFTSTLTKDHWEFGSIFLRFPARPAKYPYLSGC